jgi:uncharacterized membrane protein
VEAQVELMEWLLETMSGEFTLTVLVSMVPLVELRGGIPFGVAAGLPVWEAWLAAVIGSLIPVPFIIVYIRRIFQWMRRRSPRLDRLVDRLERKAGRKMGTALKYEYLGLFILVAIPLPGTGAWTGSLVAALLDMPLRRAVPSILAGVLAAGLAISVLTFGVSSII